MQFFVNRGKGFTTVVRCSPDEYALCGSRFVKVGCTIGENWVGTGSNVQVLRRLRGGAGVHLDIPGQWECKVCGATRCWPARKRCYRCDAPRDTVPNNLPMGPLGRALPQSRSSGPPIRSSRYNGNGGDVPPPAGELLHALTLHQRIMTPEDFVKCQGSGDS